MRQELYIVTTTDKMNLSMLTIQNDERKEQEPETEKIQAITRNGNNSNNNPKKAAASELNFNQLSAIYKRILVVDDDPDITLTFKTALEGNNDNNNNNRIFEVYTYNDPILALSEFKPHFYDLMLIDINMPDLNGFELCERILELDINIKVCFVSAVEVNDRALREVYPKISIGCFIQKPVTIDYLVKRVNAELD